MGAIFNMSAMHDNGLPQATIGIRDNAFRFRMDTTSKIISLLLPLTQEIGKIRADVVLSDSTLLEERLVDLEDRFNDLAEMIESDDYEMALEDDDGGVIVDDDGTVLVDNWSVFATLADLSSRVDILETEVGNEFIGLIATVAGMSNQVESLVNRANLHDQEIEDLKKKLEEGKKRETDLSQKVNEQTEQLKARKAEYAELSKKLKDTRNSVSFKIGRVITWLPRKIKKAIKKK